MKRWICVVLLCTLCLLPVRAGEAERYLALTFDDGPSGRFTARLLDGLAERGVKATFFLCGYRIDQYPELTARIAAEGHEIGTHGNRHEFFTQLSVEGVCADLAAASEKIRAATGREPTLLRPPGGLYDAKILRQTVCSELPVVLWSVDPEDWRCTDSDTVTRHIVGAASAGDIILMHDMSDSSVDAALRVIDTLQADGYTFLTVSELAERAGTVLRGGETYYKFSFEKNASIAAREAETEPCTKPGLPPPRPFNEEFSRFDNSRRSPLGSNST